MVFLGLFYLTHFLSKRGEFTKIHQIQQLFELTNPCEKMKVLFDKKNKRTQNSHVFVFCI